MFEESRLVNKDLKEEINWLNDDQHKKGDVDMKKFDWETNYVMFKFLY